MESKRSVIIGCPKKNDDDSFHAMLTSLRQSTNFFEKIIIAKSDDSEIVGDDIVALSGQYRTPLDAYNALFNYALEYGHDLLLTQTDVLFPRLYKRDWLQIMSKISENEQIGAVTTLNGGNFSGPDYIDGFYWLGGWCTYIPHRVIKQLGGYDSSFPNGYGVDIDYTYQIHKAGLAIIKMNYWVDHHMMNERAHDNDPNTEKAKKESSKYFKKKWKL